MKTTRAKHLVDIAKKLISPETPLKRQNDLYESLLKLSSLIVKSLGESKNRFEKMRVAKRKRNGGFLKGYILLEKVLPIGSGASQNKVVRHDKRDTMCGAQKAIAKTSPTGIRPISEKLVRDNIPAIIENQARKNWNVVCKQIAKTENISLDEIKKRPHPLKEYKAKIRIARGRELLAFLSKKLNEEAIEFQAPEDKEDILEDLGDILEIVDAYRFHFQEILKKQGQSN